MSKLNGKEAMLRLAEIKSMGGELDEEQRLLLDEQQGALGMGWCAGFHHNLGWRLSASGDFILSSVGSQEGAIIFEPEALEALDKLIHPWFAKEPDE